MFHLSTDGISSIQYANIQISKYPNIPWLETVEILYGRGNLGKFKKIIAETRFDCNTGVCGVTRI